MDSPPKLPDLPQLINLDLSEDKILVVDSPQNCLDKMLQEHEFGDLFRFVNFLLFFMSYLFLEWLRRECFCLRSQNSVCI